MQLATLRSFVKFAFEFAFASARVLFIHLPRAYRVNGKYGKREQRKRKTESYTTC